MLLGDPWLILTDIAVLCFGLRADLQNQFGRVCSNISAVLEIFMAVCSCHLVFLCLVWYLFFCPFQHFYILLGVVPYGLAVTYANIFVGEFEHIIPCLTRVLLYSAQT